MDIRLQTKIVKLMTQVVDPSHSTESVVSLSHQKPRLPEGTPISLPFQRATPESCGISSSYIQSFLKEIDEDPTLDPHLIMILKDDKVISEACFGPYSMSDWHIEYSLTKTVTGLGIGLLYDDGLIDINASIFDLLGRKKPSQGFSSHKIDITVKDLLAMRSGVSFNEAGVVCSDNWFEDFFSAGYKFKANARFDYNSMNSYMLAYIIHHLTGKTVCEYMGPRIFEPLGIKDYIWELSPEGVEQGGMGLYLRMEDMAKFGSLIMNRGIWKGRQLVSSAWINTMIKKHSSASANSDYFDYGYHIWVGRDTNSFLMNGMFGQNLLGLPDTGMIICSNFGNNESFQTSNYFKILRKYFLNNEFRPSSSRIKYDFLQRYSLRKTETSLRLRERHIKTTPFSAKSKEIFLPSLLGSFDCDPMRANSLSFMPFIVQGMQNSFGKGLKKIEILPDGEDLIFNFHEGEEIFTIPVGLKDAKKCVVDFHGEPYKISAIGRFTFNEDEVPVFILTIRPLETANMRRIKIYPSKDDLRFEFDETPGAKFFIDFVNKLDSGIIPLALGILNRRIDPDYFEYRLRKVICPVIEATKSIATETEVDQVH